MDRVPAAAVPLFALPPARFVEERNALAKQLAARGDAAAAAVRALRRPVGLAWVMNRLAQERPGDVEALLAAADRVRRGQRRALAGEGAAELRAAEDELRGRARALRDAAAPLLGERPHPQALSRLELLFRLAAASPAARAPLRAGTLEREPEAEPIDLSGLAVVPGGAAPAANRSAGARRSPSPRPSPPGRAGGEGGPGGRRGRGTAAEAARRRERAREEAEARAKEAALRRARASLARAEERARRAEAAAARAEAAAVRAADRARALRRRADDARADADARAREAGRSGAPAPP